MLRTILLAAAVVAGLFAASAAQASVHCVQDRLAALGYEPGPVDGALGGKTRAAAVKFAADAGVDLAALDKSNAWQWCAAIRRHELGAAAEALPEVNGLTALDFDIEYPGPFDPSPDKVGAYWQMHERMDRCLQYRSIYGPAITHKLKQFPADYFAQTTPDPIYPAAQGGLPACRWSIMLDARLGDPIRGDEAPEPRAVDPARADELAHVYGSNDAAVDIATFWFIRHTTNARFDPAGPDAQQVRDQLVKWAKAKTYQTSAIQVGGDSMVIWTYTTSIAGLLYAYMETAPGMTADERAVVGPWLNKLMVKILGRTDPFRTHNHMGGWGLMGVVWGLSVGDRAAVQHGIDRYKVAIHDMRPDGTFPQDHSRGGSGLSYNNLMTGDLVLMALALKHSLDLDLFSYEVDGRSIHDAVAYVLAADMDPVTYNKKYALPCDASTGDIDNPVRDTAVGGQTFEMSAYMAPYAMLFPERDASNLIRLGFGALTHYADVHPLLSAPPSCVFNTPPRFKPVG